MNHLPGKYRSRSEVTKLTGIKRPHQQAVEEREEGRWLCQTTCLREDGKFGDRGDGSEKAFCGAQKRSRGGGGGEASSTMLLGVPAWRS